MVVCSCDVLVMLGFCDIRSAHEREKNLPPNLSLVGESDEDSHNKG